MDAKQDRRDRNRVAVVGCGGLTPYSVYSLLVSDEIDELVLVGELPAELMKGVYDRIAELRPKHPAVFWDGPMGDAADASVVVVGSEPCQEGSGFVNAYEWVRRVACQLYDLNFDGVLLVTVEPVDMTLKAVSETALPSNTVMGLGSPAENIDPEAVGTSIWCTGTLKNVTFTDMCDPECPFFADVQERVRRNWNRGIGKKQVGGDVAVCVRQICEGILSRRRSLIPIWFRGANGEIRFDVRVIGSREMIPAGTHSFRRTTCAPVEVG